MPLSRTYVVVLVAAFALSGAAGCVSENHPEFHPETSYRFTQNVAYPTHTVVVPLPVQCPVGSQYEGGACVFRDAACPAGSHRVGASCVVEIVRCPEGTRWDGAGACVAKIDASCPSGLHFQGDRGCVADVAANAPLGMPGATQTQRPATPEKIPPKTAWRLTCNEEDTTPNVGCTEGIVGVRGSMADVSGGAAAHGAGVQIATGEEFYMRNGSLSALLRYGAALGGGTAGLEGTFALGAAIGFRVPVTENEGPILRIGVQGYALGNDAFYASSVEPAVGQIGWQWASGHSLFEAAATTGFVMDGRFGAGAADTRVLGPGVAYGGYASWQSPDTRLSAVLERLPAGDGLGAVDTASAVLCGNQAVSVCFDGRLFQTRARADGSTPFIRAAYAGLTLGWSLP